MDASQSYQGESRLNANVRGSEDPLPTARALGSGRFSDGLLDAIDRCMELPERDRVQNCEELLRLLRASEHNAKVVVARNRGRWFDSSDTMQAILESFSMQDQPW